jgi:hypothetical protein
MTNENQDTVVCDTHGRRQKRMICGHLAAGSQLEFIRVLPSDDPEEYETALCTECDGVLWEEDGWTDRLFAFACWKLFCDKCYEETLTRHELVHTGRLGSA